MTPAGYARRVQEIAHRLDDWLDGLPQTRSPELNRLDNHIRAHRGEWLVFLHDAEVPPTNNHAEQMLRPAVITRKVGGCNKTLWGALVHGVLASIMVSCKRQAKLLPRSGSPSLAEQRPAGHRLKFCQAAERKFPRPSPPKEARVPSSPPFSAS